MRNQYAHIIDMVPTVLDLLGIEPPATIRGVTQSPHPGRAASRTPSTTPTPPSQHRTQYFEMLGHRAIYHDGWRAVCPWPGPSFAEAGVGFGAADHRETAAELDASGWELYHVDEDFAETTNVAAENRDKLIEMIAHLVRRGRQVRRDADRRQRPGPHDRREAAGRPCRATATATARTPSRSRSSPAPRVLNRPHSITAESRSPRRRRGRAALPGHRRRRLLALRQGRQAALRPQLRRPRASTTVAVRRSGARRASTSCASSSSRPASPTWPTARARPAGCSSTSTARSSATPRPPMTTPFMFNPGALRPAAPTPARRSPPTTRARSGSPAPCTASRVDVSGELITDPEAELRAHMARQ